MTTSPIIICGAGIAGVSAAYHLAVQHGVKEIFLVDERPPLSLTSDKSTECYRNWWPDAAMTALMNRSIDWLEKLAGENNNAFHLNRRGYLYLTGDEGKVSAMCAAAQKISAHDGGPLRIHTGTSPVEDYAPSPVEDFDPTLSGADFLASPALIQRHYPCISQKAIAGLHVRRAGWFSAQQLGMFLLEQARNAGVQLIAGRVAGVDTADGRVHGVNLANGRRVPADCFINAAGPMLAEVGQMLGIELPVFSELHLKASFKDTLNAIPRTAPLLIWTDSQRLDWSAEERAVLAEDESTRWLLEEMPPGAHTRPEGGADSPITLMLWEYHIQRVKEIFPAPLDEQYPELALRGLAAMIPALKAYFDRLPRMTLDGGYYTRTQENRPLIGPLPVEGAFVSGAYAGFGLMAACAAGELLAAHITSAPLPDYAAAFSPARYTDPQYLRQLENWGDTGQL